MTLTYDLFLQSLCFLLLAQTTIIFFLSTVIQLASVFFPPNIYRIISAQLSCHLSCIVEIRNEYNSVKHNVFSVVIQASTILSGELTFFSI